MDEYGILIAIGTRFAAFQGSRQKHEYLQDGQPCAVKTNPQVGLTRANAQPTHENKNDFLYTLLEDVP